MEQARRNVDAYAQVMDYCWNAAKKLSCSVDAGTTLKVAIAIFERFWEDQQAAAGPLRSQRAMLEALEPILRGLRGRL